MTIVALTLDRFIEVTPGVCGGKPRLAGHRIRVIDIAMWHEKLDLSPDDIASRYNLTLAEVHAELAYYFDHREEIEADVQADEVFLAEMKRRFPARWARAEQE